MPDSDPFDGLLRKALQTHDFPPVPPSLLKTWQPVRAETGAKWLWIMPGMLFATGIFVGVWLAPMGLGNAFSALKDTLADVLHSLPESTVAWALALILALAVFAFDGLRSILTRLK
ncbi:MAG: hypothetical protein KAY90_00505 [Arenimonas sp.]|nr:hypothetical protein [Arenimonas sp.]